MEKTQEANFGHVKLEMPSTRPEEYIWRSSLPLSSTSSSRHLLLANQNYLKFDTSELNSFPSPQTLCPPPQRQITPPNQAQASPLQVLIISLNAQQISHFPAIPLSSPSRPPPPPPLPLTLPYCGCLYSSSSLWSTSLI